MDMNESSQYYLAKCDFCDKPAVVDNFENYFLITCGSVECTQKVNNLYEKVIKNIDDPNSQAYKIFVESSKKWDKITKPLLDAIAESERLTGDDFTTRITI